MRRLYLFFLTFSIACCSQNGEILGRITLTNSEVKFGNLDVKLTRNDSIISYSRVNEKGEFIFNNLSRGIYGLIIQKLGYRDYVTKNIEIDTALKIPYPGKCEYISMKTPRCDKGHSNNIIPIVYGLPKERTKRKAKKGKIRLGGCEITNCDPHYYCTIHNLEF